MFVHFLKPNEISPQPPLPPNLQFAIQKPTNRNFKNFQNPAIVAEPATPVPTNLISALVGWKNLSHLRTQSRYN